MTITANPDGSYLILSADGAPATHHVDKAAAEHFKATGQRLPNDQPQQPEQGGQGEQAGQNAIDKYKARCRAVGRARANKALGIK